MDYKYIIYIILIITVMKRFNAILKAVRRFNLLYDYIIVKGNKVSISGKNLTLSKSDSMPSPIDDSGCPTEEELMDAD